MSKWGLDGGPNLCSPPGNGGTDVVVMVLVVVLVSWPGEAAVTGLLLALPIIISLVFKKEEPV